VAQNWGVKGFVSMPTISFSPVFTQAQNVWPEYTGGGAGDADAETESRPMDIPEEMTAAPTARAPLRTRRLRDGGV
jgi:hypothetical protein